MARDEGDGGLGGQFGAQKRVFRSCSSLSMYMVFYDISNLQIFTSPKFGVFYRTEYQAFGLNFDYMDLYSFIPDANAVAVL